MVAHHFFVFSFSPPLLADEMCHSTLLEPLVIPPCGRTHDLFLGTSEPLVRIELTTSSLPRKCSTTELQRRTCWSGRRGSNSPPIAWKAIALPNELLPLIEQQCFAIKELFIPKDVGRSGFEPLKSKDSGFTVRPIWPLWNLPVYISEPKMGLEPATY